MEQVFLIGGSGGKIHKALGNVVLIDVVHGFVLVVILVDKLIVKGVDQLGTHHLASKLCKGLTQANSGSTQERSIAVRVPFVSIWS